MGKSLVREYNFEEVCVIEPGYGYIGTEDEFMDIRREWYIQSRGPMTEKALYAKWWSYIWNGKNKWIRRSCRNRMWWKWKTIVKICRLLMCKCFVYDRFCNRFFFDRKPAVYFYEFWCDKLILRSVCNDTWQWILNTLKFVEICLWDARVKWDCSSQVCLGRQVQFCKSCGYRERNGRLVDEFDGCLGYENDKIWNTELIWSEKDDDQMKAKIASRVNWSDLWFIIRV